MHTNYEYIKREYMDLSSNITNLLNTIREKSDLEFKPITSMVEESYTLVYTVAM